SAGNLSRYTALQSDWMLQHAPDTASAFWGPARAVLGDYVAFAAGVAFAVAVLGLGISRFSRRFGRPSVSAGGGSGLPRGPRRRQEFGAPPCASGDGASRFATALPPELSGTRNGYFCGAMPGWCHRH